MTTTTEWLQSYALLALRINRQIIEQAGGSLLDYRGPTAWLEQAANEEPPPPGQLVDEANRLLSDLPFDDPQRAAFLAAQTLAMRAAARRLSGQQLPLRDYVRECLAIEVEWLPETLFEKAHAQLEAALPSGNGSLGERLHAWQAAYRLPTEQMSRLPQLVSRAVSEARARLDTVIRLPVDEVIDCTLVSAAGFHGAGAHHGGTKSTMFINQDLPFNLADLLYIVTHEGHPGHIAESMLKEIHLVRERGYLEQQVRFMVSPQYVISEGLALNAEAAIFPGDEAQLWLNENVLPEFGMRLDDCRLVAIHEARNVLWGAWANASFMIAQGRSDREVRAYLAQWALLSEAELTAMGPGLSLLKAPFAEPYIFCYYHGWQRVRSQLETHGHQQLRRLLTEQMLP